MANNKFIYFTLHRSVLHHMALYDTVLHLIIMHYVVMKCITQHCLGAYSTVCRLCLFLLHLIGSHVDAERCVQPTRQVPPCRRHILPNNKHTCVHPLHPLRFWCRAEFSSSADKQSSRLEHTQPGMGVGGWGGRAPTFSHVRDFVL